MISFLDLQSILFWKSFEAQQGERPVNQLYYDSRLIVNGSEGVFFALNTERSDGHAFIPQAYEKGIRQWVISDPNWENWLRAKGDQNWVLVDEVLDSLQQLAAWQRKQFTGPVLGITGSNGKTIVKEWLSQITGPEKSICKSPKSFNSQLGVALSVWNLQPHHSLGIFEAGISKIGEMGKLESIIRPDLGIFTNLGTAHQEGFPSTETKLEEKLGLFKNARSLILPLVLFEKYKAIFEKSLPRCQFKTWYWEKETGGGLFQLEFNGKSSLWKLPFQDDASLENLGNSISAALELSISTAGIQERLSGLNLPEMRLSLKEGFQGNLILDDTYTNDLSGLEAALQFADLQRKKNQTLALVLSDFEETSESFPKTKSILLELLTNYKVNLLFSIGKEFKDLQVNQEILHTNVETLQEIKEVERLNKLENSVILVKGARRFKLENLVKTWQKKVHGTRLEINLDAMVHNLNFYRSQLKKGTGIMAMVKALGYGSGDEEIARILEYHNIEYLAVAYADEGIKLRQAGISTPIMVMNPTEDALAGIFQYQLEPEIYNFRIMSAFLSFIEDSDTTLWPAIHLKIDTGMHRLGFLTSELEEVCKRLNQVPKLKIATVFTHLAGADEEDLNAYSKLQIERFDSFCAHLESTTGRSFKKHVLNSAGILRFPKAQYDLVRLGIGLYGIEVNAWFQDQLRPVSRLITTISQIKSLPAGETVGYGRRTRLERDSKIATIALGYSDGFRRDFSQGAANVKVGNQWAPVVGNVCMDMTMIDVTDLVANEGDEVIIFEDAESLLQLAAAAQTIPYEILTGIGHRVKRIFYRE